MKHLPSSTINATIPPRARRTIRIRYFVPGHCELHREPTRESGDFSGCLRKDEISRKFSACQGATASPPKPSGE